MKTRQKILISLAAVLLGTGASLLAGDSSTPASGLLGRNYFEGRYVWTKLSDSPVDANGFAFDANWSVRSNLDFTMGYDWLETESYFGIKGERRTLLVGLRLMSRPDRSRFYVEAAAGYGWASVTTVGSDNASAFRAGVGAEFACTPSIVLTPFLNATRYGGDGDDTIVNYGVKASFLLGENWHVATSIQRDDDNNMSYGAGLGFRF